MEVRHHVHILKRAKWFIILCTLLTAVAALCFVLFRPVTYKAVVSFDVLLANRTATADYQYGTYYDLKAAEIYTQHVMSWFMTPAVVEDVYRGAGQSYTITSISKFTNRFQAKQYSPQNFVVIFNEHNFENAQRLAESVTQVVETRSSEAVKIADKSAFEVRGLTPVIVEEQINLAVAVAVGLIAGLMLSVVLVYLREYFRE